MYVYMYTYKYTSMYIKIHITVTIPSWKIVNLHWFFLHRNLIFNFKYNGHICPANSVIPKKCFTLITK